MDLKHTNMVLNLRTKNDLLRRAVTAAVRDLTTEADAVGGPDATNLRSIATGLRLILAQTTDGTAEAAAMIPVATWEHAASALPRTQSPEGPTDDSCPECNGTGGFQGQNDNLDFMECLYCDGTGKKKRGVNDGPTTG